MNNLPEKKTYSTESATLRQGLPVYHNISQKWSYQPARAPADHSGRSVV